MALGLVGCMGHFFGKPLDQCMFLGELSLDGSVRPVRGALSATLAARECGLKSIAVPQPNAREAAVVDGVDVFALKSLPQAVDLVNAPESFQPVRVDAQLLLSEAAQYAVDLRDVPGQQAAKRVLEVACAGGHNILFINRRARAKQCWRSGFRRFCHQCRWRRRSRRRESTAWQECRRIAVDSWGRGHFVRLTTRLATPG